MKKYHSNVPKYRAKRPIRQRVNGVLKWIGGGAVLMVGVMALSPLLLAHHHRVQRMQQWLLRYHYGVWGLHILFILSSLFWWPMYIRWRGKCRHWSQEAIDNVSQYKWGILLMLLGLNIIFFST